jgi:phosphonate transport system substrate-binding protein
MKSGILAFAASTLTALTAVVAAIAAPATAHAEEKALAFHVLNHRTIALTAQYWNPILTYVSAKSGVPLELKLAKTAHDGNTSAEKGLYDFIYTNHFFTPERDRLGYKVIARPAGAGIQAQIVVPADSPAQKLEDLNGKDVAFVSKDGFTGYWLPLDALLKANVKVNEILTGNQEASSAQLKVKKVAAAGVNSKVMAAYASREAFDYRVLWTSEVYQDLCIMANPKVPGDKVAAVRKAFIGMSADPEGRKILEEHAALFKLGFVSAENRDYDNYRKFYLQTQVK